MQKATEKALENNNNKTFNKQLSLHFTKAMLWPVVSQTFSGIDNNQCCPQFYAHDPTTNARNTRKC